MAVGVAEQSTEGHRAPKTTRKLRWNMRRALAAMVGFACIRMAEGQYTYPINHTLKTHYKIGGLGINGADELFAQMNATFGVHLSAVAGPKFNPPLTFELVYLNFTTTFTWVEDNTIDFIYTNPSLFVCADMEFDLSSIATLRRSRLGKAMSQFGGVIFVRADNDEVNSIRDLKGKSIAAASISGLGSGQAQWLEMARAKMSLMQDPKQVIFTSNQIDVVKMVYNKEADVGFVRTDQIEGMESKATLLTTGVPTQKALFKYIDKKTILYDGGKTFPFESSTELYPEWNLAALSTVDWKVSNEVQRALAVITSSSVAAKNGSYLNWQPSLSYTLLQDMQKQIGLLYENEDKKNLCLRSDQLYDLITCPAGHFKKSQDEVSRGCADAGLVCPAKLGYSCVCRPCIKLQKVQIIAMNEATAANSTNTSTSSIYREHCPKMSVCGSFDQLETFYFVLVDNGRSLGNYSYNLRVEDDVIPGEFKLISRGAISDYYNITLSLKRVGTHVLELFHNGEQLESSPVRLSIRYRDCSKTYGEKSHRVPDAQGACTCEVGTFESGGVCVETQVVLLSILLPLAFLLIVAALIYNRISKATLDSAWQLRESDLVYANPPVVIGKGSFGLVLLADCRGTTVAVKRVLPSMMASAEDDKDMFELDSWVQKTKDAGAFQESDTSSELFEGDDNVGYSSSFKTPDVKAPSSAVPSSPTNAPAPGPTVSNEAGWANQGRHKSGNAIYPEAAGSEVPSTEQKDDNLNGQREKIKMLAWIQSGSNPLPDLQQKSDSFATDGYASTNPLKNGQIMDGHASVRALASGNVGTGSMMDGHASAMGYSTWVQSRVCGVCVPFEYYNQKRYLKSLKSDFIEEMRIISNLRHPSITTVMGAVLGKEPMLVMEYMTLGSLSDLLLNESYILEPDLLLVMIKDIVQGMRFLHTAKPAIVHGDLKAANVLITENFKAKVADFGLSQKKRLGNFGTPYWMAPELLAGQTSTPESDVYAFSIMLYEIFSRKEPYAGENPSEVLMAVADTTREPEKRPGIPAGCRPEVEVMMKDCWNNDPDKRPPFMELDRRIKAMDVNGMQSKAVRSFLKEEMERQGTTQKVLFDIFPRHIAEALVAGRKVEPEKKECVTIFFSDIVGFTDISAMLDPQQVSEMLDRLYTAFDQLSSKYGVYKVETIGDAYMAVTNLVSDQNDDHAARIARFALDAVKTARSIPIDVNDPSKGNINIRVGFHSGPVVANVVGTRCPRYCLFGDTVNTSSRMESNSKPGMINCSLAAAKLVHKQAEGILLQKRGVIPIKGKGNMVCYWVKGEVSNATLSHLQSISRMPALLPTAPAPGHEDSERSMRSLMSQVKEVDEEKVLHDEHLPVVSAPITLLPEGASLSFDRAISTEAA